MFAELTVVLKDESRTMRQKFALYDVFTCSPDDMVIHACINEAMSAFEGEPDSVQVKIHMEV